jgi:hypothetical protein
MNTQHEPKGKVAHNKVYQGPEQSGEQAQNPSKPTQLCASPPWAKSRRSKELSWQN